MKVYLLSKDVKNIGQAISEALRFEKIRGVTPLEDRVNRVIGERENPHVTALRNAQGRPQRHNQRPNHSPGSGIPGHIARTCTWLLGLGQTNRIAGQGGYANPTHGASQETSVSAVPTAPTVPAETPSELAAPEGAAATHNARD